MFATKTKASNGARPGSSVPKGRNYQANRFAGLMPGGGSKKKPGKKAPPKLSKGKKPATSPAGFGLALAMRGK